MSSNGKGYYRKKFKELRRERGGKCELDYDGCWKSSGLEFMHIKATGLIGRGRGQAVRYHDIKNNPDCYVLACRMCHSKWDDLHPDFHNYGEGPDVDGEEQEVPF